jgi:putative AbiEii toxin of type IV toxin-antitoxin system
MSVAEKTMDEAGEQSWDLSFSAVELKESASLGADVRLELAPRTTVLVGKNGAGKSLLLEKMFAAFGESAGWDHAAEPDPARFACEVAVEPRRAPEKNFMLRYECHWSRREDELENSGAKVLPSTSFGDLKVEEACWILGDENQVLWRVEDGAVTVNNGGHGVIFGGMTLLSLGQNRGRQEYLLPDVVKPLRDLFYNVSQVPAGIPRGDSEREELALPYPAQVRPREAWEPRRLHALAYTLIDFHETDRELFNEFVELGRRIGLVDEVTVKLYRDPDANRTARSRDFASVLFDGINLGLLSDGTLRTAEILFSLIFPGVKVLLIEEPETAVHPGLLSKLLAEIEACSIDRQIVLSTQSPQVVSWADPRALRLIERHADRTSVRSLREDEIGRVSAYLNDEGTLGDFVYSGALDG